MAQLPGEKDSVPEKMMMQLDGQNVCAVVVTRNIGYSYTANLGAVIDQVGQVIIVDNGSDEETVRMLTSVQTQYPEKLTVIFNTVNKGIGAAQNQGVEKALESGCEWILFLDHDSRPASDMVGQLLRAYLKLTDQETGLADRTGLMAPNIREQKFPKDMKLIKPGISGFWRKFGKNRVVHGVRSVIASGSLIKKEVFLDMGGFNESFFMDYVDVEFCLRMHQKGWKIAAVRDAVLHHNLGDIRAKRWMGYDLRVSNHDSFRRFTMFRNRTRVWKTFFFMQPGYILFDMTMAGLELTKILLYESDRKQKIMAAVKGAIEGMTT